MLDGVALASANLQTTTIEGVTYYVIPADQVEELGALTASNLDGDLSPLSFRYEVIDPATAGSVAAGSAVRSETLTLTAIPVTDTVDASISAIELTGATGTTADNDVDDDASPDTLTLTGGGTFTVNLHVDSADSDGSEHLVRILISDVPDGVTVSDAAQLGSGTWLLVYEAGSALALDADGVDVSIEFVVGAGAANGRSTITMTPLAQDRGDQAGSEASIVSDAVSWQLELDLTDGSPPAPPSIDEWSYNGTRGSEDTEFALGDVIDAAVTTNDPAQAYRYSITLRDLPEGSSVEGMTQSTIDGETIYTATVIVAPGGDSQAALEALLGSIRVTAPENANDNNAPFDFDATLAAAAVGGVTLSENANVDMPIEPVSDPAEVVVTANGVDEGVTSLAATITVSNPIDGTDGQIVDGNLYVQVTASGNPGGSVSDADGNMLTPVLVSGITGVPDGTYYVFDVGSAGRSVQLTYTAASGEVLQPGDVSFAAWVQTREEGAPNVVTESGSGTAEISISNNGVTVESSPVTGAEASVVENAQAIELAGLGIALVDDDGSEEVQSILLSGVPVGFQILIGNNAGDATVAAQAANAGGGGGTSTWVLSDDGAMPAYVAILPTAHWSGELTGLALVVESAETSLGTARVDSIALDPVTIEAVANGVDIDPTLSFGTEGDIIDLNLNASMADPVISPVANDDSVETTILQLTGLGEFAAFYVGGALFASVDYEAATDTYTLAGLAQDELDQLGFVQAASALTDQDAGTEGTQILVSAGTVESANGDQSSLSSGMLTLLVDRRLATSSDDSFIMSAAAINGGGGTDSVALRMEEGVSRGDLATLLSNIEEIDLSVPGANAILGGLTVADVQTVTGSGSGTLRISGDGNDRVELASGAWTTNDVVTSGYVTYTSIPTGATLMIQELVAVSYLA